MKNLADFFEIDSTLISFIIGAVLIILSAGIIFMCFKNKTDGSKKDKTVFLALSIVSFVLTAVSNFIAYHYIIMIASILCATALSASLAKLNLAYNQNKSFSVGFVNLFLRYLIPVYILFLLFGPWFLDVSFYGEGETFKYQILSMFGLKGVGVYAFSFEHIGLITILELLLFAGLIAAQIYTISALFKNPDYCDTWSLFHLIITAVGAIFIFGIYTSNNFDVLGIMPPASKGMLVTSFLMYMVIFLAAVNKILYLKKVDLFLNKI